MQHNTYIYIFIMVFVCFLIRALPMLLIQKPIENRFIRSFLYYVPYVTLAVMTFPAIVEATRSPIAGALALFTGVILFWGELVERFGFLKLEFARICGGMMWIMAALALISGVITILKAKKVIDFTM